MRKTSLISDIRGAGLIEYSFLAGLVAVAGITAISNYGAEVSQSYEQINSALASGSGRADEVIAEGAPEPSTPPRAAFSSIGYTSGEECILLTPGDDFLNLPSDPPPATCYNLKTGFDTVLAGALTTDMTFLADADPGSGKIDDISLGSGNDTFIGSGKSEISAGEGSDQIALSVTPGPGDFTVDLGEGDDVFHLDASGFNDGATFFAVNAHTGPGEDEILGTCDHMTKPSLRIWPQDGLSLRSTCQTGLIFDQAGFDADVSALLEGETYGSKLIVSDPGTLQANVSLKGPQLGVELHEPLTGAIAIDGDAGAPSPIEVLFGTGGGKQADLGFDMTGTFAEAKLHIPQELNGTMSLEFSSTDWSQVWFQLGPRSVIGELPPIAIKDGETRISFYGWKGATDDDLLLEFLDAQGTVTHSYDMALPGYTYTTTSIWDPASLGIVAYRLTRQGQSETVEVNTPDADFQVYEFEILHE